MSQYKIRAFFNGRAIDRNQRIASKPIVEYEQKMRSLKVISLLEPKPEEKILDVGCGNARDLVLIAKMKCKCTGVDISNKMIEEARTALKKHGIENVRLEIGDVTNLNYANEMFDKIFASEVLEHVPDYKRAIAEMTRMLKPNGTLIITTPNRESLYGFDRYLIYETIERRRWKDKHPYDEWKTFNELKSALCGSGLRIISCEGICYVPGFFIPYKLPQFLQKILLRCVNIVEPCLSKLLPKNGYMVAIKAMKFGS